MSNRLMRWCVMVVFVAGSIILTGCDPGQDNTANSPSNTAATSNSGATGGTKSGTNAAASTYFGGVDFRDCQAVKGWVWNSADPKADIKVSLYIDDKLVETVPAKTMRADLKSQNIGTGEYAFAFNIPSTFRDDKPHTVSVKTAGGEYTLPNVPGLYPTATCKP